MNTINAYEHRGFSILVSLLAAKGRTNYPFPTTLDYDSFVELLRHLKLEATWCDVWRVMGATITWLEKEGYIQLLKLNYSHDGESEFCVSFTPSQKWLQALKFSFEEPVSKPYVFCFERGKLVVQLDKSRGDYETLPVAEPARSLMPTEWFKTEK